MNNKGFTLIEVLGTLAIISVVLLVVVSTFQDTVSLSKEESYKIMKNNIIKASNDYINECQLRTIDCNFSEDENIQFKAQVLKEKGYFKNLNSPIDGKNIEECLIINAKKENGTIKIDLIDNCY